MIRPRYSEQILARLERTKFKSVMIVGRRGGNYPLLIRREHLDPKVSQAVRTVVSKIDDSGSCPLVLAVNIESQWQTNKQSSQC